MLRSFLERITFFTDACHIPHWRAYPCTLESDGFRTGKHCLPQPKPQLWLCKASRSALESVARQAGEPSALHWNSSRFRLNDSAFCTGTYHVPYYFTHLTLSCLTR